MKLADVRLYQRPARPQTDTRESPGPPGIARSAETSVPLTRGVVETVRNAREHHGRQAPIDLLQVSGDHFAMLNRDPELAYVDFSRAVFLDTETTGLGMGVGTYVFLVGAGYLDNEEFRVKQFFLKSPADENDFLAGIAEFLGQFSAVVSFNGKAFDWPLLENRYIFRRRPPPLQDPPHLDLLHPSRRLWKTRLESCALSSLEANVLRVQRTGADVPGWMIPSLYFDYLRSGNADPLGGVFYHNLMDVLSLAALTVHIHRIVGRPMGQLVDDAIDLFCLGKAFDRSADGDSASMCYEEALVRGLPQDLYVDCLFRLSLVQKRARRWDAALQSWYRLIDEGGSACLFALVEMAKYFEHVERDFAQAAEAVDQALMLADLHKGLWPDAERLELEHRRARLTMKSAPRQRAHSRL